MAHVPALCWRPILLNFGVTDLVKYSALVSALIIQYALVSFNLQLFLWLTRLSKQSLVVMERLLAHLGNEFLVSVVDIAASHLLVLDFEAVLQHLEHFFAVFNRHLIIVNFRHFSILLVVVREIMSVQVIIADGALVACQTAHVVRTNEPFTVASFSARQLAPDHF